MPRRSRRSEPEPTASEPTALEPALEPARVRHKIKAKLHLEHLKPLVAAACEGNAPVVGQEIDALLELGPVGEMLDGPIGQMLAPLIIEIIRLDRASRNA